MGGLGGVYTIQLLPVVVTCCGRHHELDICINSISQHGDLEAMETDKEEQVHELNNVMLALMQ
jgi:hypothetical protein